MRLNFTISFVCLQLVLDRKAYDRLDISTLNLSSHSLNQRAIWYITKMPYVTSNKTNLLHWNKNNEILTRKVSYAYVRVCLQGEYNSWLFEVKYFSKNVSRYALRIVDYNIMQFKAINLKINKSQWIFSLCETDLI